jgi:stearoyl-CoA desaturase (Delta-9 desaturase)
MAAPAESIPQPEGSPSPDADGIWQKQFWISRVIYWGIHAACFLAFFTGVSTADLLLLGATYWARMFGITGGYHRYFSHKAYKTGRVFQFLLAFLGASSVQKGPLWWAGTHRKHHRFSDREGDPHSPKEGFWHSHAGWIFSGEWDETDTNAIRDFAQYPELNWLNRWHIVPPLMLVALCWGIGGLSGLVWGFAISTTLLWHSTYAINSLAHVWGSRRYETTDTSRNNLWLALLTMGEGWHNNHHRYAASSRNGFFWWEVDFTYYTLRGLEKLGLIWDLRTPPPELLEKP